MFFRVKASDSSSPKPDVREWPGRVETRRSACLQAALQSAQQPSDVFAEGECRNIVIGQVDDVLLTVVYTSPEEDLYRIISARPVTAHERKAYEQNFFQP